MKGFSPADRDGETVMDPHVWQRGFRETTSGLSCAECHALVPRHPLSTRAHREWHAALGVSEGRD